MGKIKGPRNVKVAKGRHAPKQQHQPKQAYLPPPKHEYFPGFTASSSKSESRPITATQSPKAPTLLFTDDAWLTIKHIVNSQSAEVGWFGLVRQLNETTFEVYEIFVPEQTVTGATVDIDHDAIAKLFNQLIMDNKPAENLVYHGHSHVSMAVNPSGTDEIMFEEYAFRAHERFFRSIHNKQGDSRVDCVDKTTGYIHTRIEHGIRKRTLNNDAIKRLDETLNMNVKCRTYQSITPPYANSLLSAADINQRYADRMRVQDMWNTQWEDYE